MRKILTEAEIAKRKKRNGIIIGIFLLGIMLISTAGYAFLNSSSSDNTQNSQPQSNSAVTQTANGYTAQVQGHTLFFSYSPESVKIIPIDMSAQLIFLQGKDIYIASNNTAITQELTQNLAQFSSHVQEACYGKCDQDLPEKNCTDNLIIWRDSLENKVSQKDSCIFIDGDSRAVDAFLYKLFNLS